MGVLYTALALYIRGDAMTPCGHGDFLVVVVDVVERRGKTRVVAT